MNALAVKRTVERGVDGPIPSSDLLIDNRANLPGPCVDGKLPALVADFVRETDSDGPVPFGRNAKARPNMIADPIPSLTGACRGENIKSRFEPIGPAVGDFDGFVQSVVGREEAIYHLLRAVNREIAVQFHHGVAGLDGIVAVDLNFVVILCGGCLREEKQAKGRGKDQDRAETWHR